MNQEQRQMATLTSDGNFQRWGQDLITRIPPATQPNSRVLEFGCGNGAARSILESMGYSWIGIDIAGDNVSARCDGHMLPFPDHAFDLVVTVAVFEHLYDPFKAARELFRMLKPGGVVVGTTAFLEQFHANSYFHMTHLGVQRVFTAAGFAVEDVWPTWHFAESLATFWVPRQLSFPHQAIATSFRVAAHSLMRVRNWGLRYYLRRHGVSGEEIAQRIQIEQLTWSGAIGFLACKPGQA